MLLINEFKFHRQGIRFSVHPALFPIGQCSLISIKKSEFRQCLTLGMFFFFGWNLLTNHLVGQWPESTPLPVRTPRSGPLFESIPSAHSELNLVHQLPESIPVTLMQEQGAGAGICAGDIDGDGLPDLLISNYNKGCRLYRNLGHWKFSDITDQAGLETTQRWCGGVAMVDIDNDGDLDLYICCLNAPNLLFINRGNGSFTEQAVAYGLAWTGASVMAAFCDYDRDGQLDLYLLTHRNPYGREAQLPRDTREAVARGILLRTTQGRFEIAPAYRELFALTEKAEGRAELSIVGEADQLFRQLPNGHFTNVTEHAGIRGNDIGLGVSWWDYDGDGWPDIYVANDHKTPDRLWKNQRDGTFKDFTAIALPLIPFSSMGTDVGDVNNDGRLDLIATDMAGSSRERRMQIDQDPEKNRWFLEHSVPPQLSRNSLFLATGLDRVLEAARLTGLDASDWTWSPKFGDFDNDGWVDLFIANGMSRDFLNGDLLAKMAQPRQLGWRHQSLLKETNLAFRNRGELHFVRSEVEWGLNQLTASFGTAVADFDQDGNLDLAVMNLGEAVALYRNREAANHRMTLRLKGTRSNRWGIGAVATVETQQGLLTRTISLTSGFMSANEPLLHFGLSSNSSVRCLTVEWPSGGRQQYKNLPADRAYTLTEPETRSTPSLVIAQTNTWLIPSKSLEGFGHSAGVDADANRHASLPWRFSQRGPVMAVGDLNGDGFDDFYLGGSKGESGILGVRQLDGSFRRIRLPAFEADRGPVDSGALFFDADGDGDLDLYVVAGGVDSPVGSPFAKDRLYLNDGQGGFNRASSNTLLGEAQEGNVVCAGDFDRDGDLDLFIGGGSVPENYPLARRSRLLRNEQGRFRDITDQLIPELNRVGVVTGAVWSDANGDGRLDLVITCEWGKVSLFLNDADHFENATASSGFGARPGLWQCVLGCDVDGDGDIDYITGNFGLNSNYRGTVQDPLFLYRGDLEGTGQTNLLLVQSEAGVLYPQLSRRSLLALFPSLVEKYPTFESLAKASMNQLFEVEHLNRAEKFQINTLESGVWINDGKAHFRFVALPVEAQLAPSFGMATVDLGGEGYFDLFLAQNFRAKSQLGPLDGGVGLMLRGLGTGEFKAIAPTESGWIIRGDGRSVGGCDLNQDSLPDLIVGSDGSDWLSFQNQAPKRVGQSLAAFEIRLRGRSGNPFGIGSSVSIQYRDGSQRTAEVYAGGNRCASAGASLYFPYRIDCPPIQVKVRWPDGKRTATALKILKPIQILAQD